MRLVPGWFSQRQARASHKETAPLTLQQEDTRRELMAMAVRDTLRKHGIPQHWVKPETVSALTAGRTRGMHLRLVLREWRPEVLAYTVALQRAILVRLIRLDPLSPGWAAGISWRYEPVDDSTCAALPPPQFWQQGRTAPAAADVAANDSVGAAPQRADFCPTEPMQVR